MARTLITPTLLTADSSATSLTTVAASTSITAGFIGAGNGVQFTNAPIGQFLLLVSNTSTVATTLNVAVGTTVLGQAVTAYTVSVPASTMAVLGPFHSYLDTPGTTLVGVDFITFVTSQSCGLIQLPGVY